MTTTPCPVDAAADGVAKDLARRAEHLQKDLVVFPHRVSADGVGIYPDPATFLVKELRADGVDAVFLDPPERRRFEVKNSALLDSLNAVILGVASSAAWEAFKFLLRRRTTSAPLTITYLDLAPDGARREFTATGPADQVLDSIDRLRNSTPGAEDGAEDV